jgi:dephospho-CoA kinase
MKIFVIVGMPGAGKNIGRAYAESRQIPYFATGDLVRDETQRRGLEPNGANTAMVSTELRGDDGMGVTRIALGAALNTGKPVVLMEGMRSWPEIQLIRERATCIVVAFIAPRALRRQRISSRGRSDDVADAFNKRDTREIAYGASVPIALADEYVLNTGTVEEALHALDHIVRR